MGQEPPWQVLPQVRQGWASGHSRQLASVTLVRVEAPLCEGQSLCGVLLSFVC